MKPGHMNTFTESFFQLIITCFVLDAINNDKEEEEESSEATLISVVKMIMCPTCLSSLYGSYAYAFFTLFISCFVLQ